MLANAAVSTFFPCHPLELLITWNKTQLLTLTANDKITKRDKVHRCKELLNINSVLIHETLQQNYINWLIMTTSVTDTTTTAKCQFHQVSYNNVCSWVNSSSSCILQHQETILQESCAIAKTTARCALYIGYSTIILFTPTFTTLCGFDSERI